MQQLDRLGPAQVAEVLALAEAATTTDGAAPLAEHVLLRLRDPAAPATHLTVRDSAGGLVGYAHLDLTEPASGVTVELVVHPGRRRRGIGRELASAALTATDTPVRVWAHGDHPSAAALAVDLGLIRSRLLWQLRRPLAGLVTTVHLPEDVALRAFRPGDDDAEWLALNVRAFAAHPEQGRWTMDDLRVRLAEPWFDPAGFLLAERISTGELLGFHWTKVHAAPGAEPVGEVYVLGVDPAAHGGGLGKALTLAGLAHLSGRGLHTVMLYVDDTNTGAVRLYERLGFARWTAHVQYEAG